MPSDEIRTMKVKLAHEVEVADLEDRLAYLLGAAKAELEVLRSLGAPPGRVDALAAVLVDSAMPYTRLELFRRKHPGDETAAMTAYLRSRES